VSDTPQSPGAFWQRPAFKKGLAALLVAVALGLAFAGWLTHAALWLLAAAGVLAVLAIVEAAITAQAAFHARRQRIAEAWALIDERIDGHLAQLKADYWRGNHYGRQGLESSWRWRNALADQAALLWAGLPDDGRVASEHEVRTMMERRTEEAIAEDPYWVFYDPRMERAEFVHYCALVLEEYNWTVVAPPPGCFRAVDLAAEREGTLVVLRCQVVVEPLRQETLERFARDAAEHGLDHAVLVVDGALHHELRYRAEDLGVGIFRHDDLAVLGAQPGSMPRIKPQAALAEGTGGTVSG